MEIEIEEDFLNTKKQSCFLSTGAIFNMVINREIVEKPIVQILKIYAISEIALSCNDVKLIYRLTISDSKNVTSFSTYFDHSKIKLNINDFIQLNEYEIQEISNGKEKRTNIVIYEIEVIKQNGTQVGKPVDIYNRTQTNYDELQQNSTKTKDETEKVIKEEKLTIKEPQKESCTNLKPDIAEQWECNGIDNRVVLINQDKPLSMKRLNISQLKNLIGNEKLRNWCITVRVINKETVIGYLKNGKGIKTDVELKDETGEIMGYAFEQLAEDYDRILMVGCCYYISDAILRNAPNNNINTDKLEIKFTPKTIVKPCATNILQIPSLLFKFIPLNKINNGSLLKSITYDIYGICVSITPSQDDKIITLISPECVEPINFCLRGTKATKFNPGLDENPIIVAKNVRISFTKNSVFCDARTLCLVNPENFPYSNILKQWYAENKEKINKTNITSPIENTDTVLEIEDCDNLGSALKKFKAMGVSTAIIKCSTNICDTDAQYNLIMMCEKCSKPVYDFNLPNLCCNLCGPLERAKIKKIFTKIRLGNDENKKWVELPDYLFRKLINLSSNYIHLYDTIIWDNMKKLKNKTVNVTLQVEKNNLINETLKLLDITLFDSSFDM